MVQRFLGAPRLFVLAALCSLLSVNCGGDGGSSEAVYIHVFNAYPGSSSLSLYGPTGAIATGLAFGERTDEPVLVDRNLGSEFTLLIDGSPETVGGSLQLFNLYPHETATFLVSKRREGADATFQMLRHVQSFSNYCRIGVHNSLALSNDNIGEFSFLLGWDFSNNLAAAGYDLQAENAHPTADGRTSLFNEINDNPYFVLSPVETADGQTVLQFVWLGSMDDFDGPRVDVAAGSVLTAPTTSDYLLCADLSPGEDCTSPRRYSTTSYGPDAGTISEMITYRPESIGNPAGECGASWRIFGDFSNIFGLDNQGNPGLVDHEASFEPGNHLFFVLYGRPIQPLVETWASGDEESGGGFGDLESYPGR